MNIITALYGSQYSELENKGYDVQKGRFYANMLLTATILIYLFLTLIILNIISEDITDTLTRPIRRFFGNSLNKGAAQLVITPIVIVVYLIVMVLFGSKKRYEKSYKIYSQATKEEKDKATEKMLGIFIIGLLSMFVLGIVSLFL